MNDARKALPPESAFVVQLCAGTGLEPGKMEGRVEHVMSGEAMRFESLATLAAFFARVLIARGPPRPGG